MKRRSKRTRVEQFLTKYKELLKITAWEREIYSSRGAISKFFKNKNPRKLTTKEVNDIDDIILDIIETYYDNK
ncbi:hypothetical protein [Aquimarina latercula]|uniref:hypothetical protein n=1 Tax=Aquimarina latercula TaxID=987 RepID=UPI0003FA7F8C|nr:hypothetical protein [Aquimarina latercula]